VTSVPPFSIVAGPAKVYVAAADTAQPAINATPSGAWTYLGYTEGGVQVAHSQNINYIGADQVTTPLKAIRTEEGLSIEFGLAEMTLENFGRVLNSNSVTETVQAAGYKELDLYRGDVVKTLAMVVRGPSPYGSGTSSAWEMQYWVPVVVMSGEPQTTLNKDDKSVLQTQWMALYSETNAFGKLRARNQA
jgi:hypothetical protein